MSNLTRRSAFASLFALPAALAPSIAPKSTADDSARIADEAKRAACALLDQQHQAEKLFATLVKMNDAHERIVSDMLSRIETLGRPV